MVLLVCVIAGFVFAVVAVAYEFGLRGESRTPFRQGLREIRHYRPPVDVVLEYRNGQGFRTLRRLAVLKAFVRRDGRLYLFGISHRPARPRMFRVDRIRCIATPDGEVVDTAQFLLQQLALPADLVRGLRGH